MLLLLVFFLFLSGSLLAAPDEGQWARRIQAHITIRDYEVAVDEAQAALRVYPHSLSLHEAYIRALAHLGEEKKLFQAWEVYIQQFPDKALNREMIEEMAWGVLQKASHSYSLIMRQMALLAAFFSKDAKGVSILVGGMNDSNYAIRAVAVKLAGHFRDQKIIDQVTKLFKTEKNWAVRQKVIEAIGNMKIMTLAPQLEALIASEESFEKEKALSIAALLELLDAINRPEIERLAASNRTGLRQLACQAIAHFHSLRDVDQLLRLAEDSQADVRLEAFQALGKLKPMEQKEAILKLARQSAHDRNYQVALSAVWLLTLYAPQEGQKAFIPFLQSERREVRSLTAGAISAAGRYGISLALEQFRTHPDPYVRLNLAIGLIGQRQATQEAAHAIRLMLKSEKEKWSSSEAGIFRAIVNSSSKNDDPLITPEMENQLLRLELLNVLAILKIPETQQAIRDYLAERSWEITITASALLLTEGDEAAIEIVQNLLKDPQRRIRVHAALILSLWSREESALQVLEEEYSKGDWDEKAKILEGLGRIGSMHSVPFLLNILKEPSQTLRLIAALALIQCLNH